jgi:methyl-accepting chemotaxis protein
MKEEAKKVLEELQSLLDQYEDGLISLDELMEEVEELKERFKNDDEIIDIIDDFLEENNLR